MTNLTPSTSTVAVGFRGRGAFGFDFVPIVLKSTAAAKTSRDMLVDGVEFVMAPEGVSGR